LELPPPPELLELELPPELLELEPLSELFALELLLSELELFELEPESGLELELLELLLLSELELLSELLEFEPPSEDVAFDSDLVNEPPLEELASLEELDFGLSVESAELLVLAAADSLLELDVLGTLAEPESLAGPDPPSSELDPLAEPDSPVELEPPSGELPTLLSAEVALGALSAAVIGAVRALSADPADGAGAESWVDPAID
jgi:hypothetical protein